VHQKMRKNSAKALRASVKKEMAKPRIARSARIEELNLDISRIREQPSVTLPATVNRIIPSPHPSLPEKAQIVLDGPDHRHRNIRIENALTNEHGDDVKLKKGTNVDVTVTEGQEK
jgi:hypothetical protein